MLDGVFAFLQLGDVQLRLGAVQPLEPQLVAVDVGDDGAETQTQPLLDCQSQLKANAIKRFDGLSLNKSNYYLGETKEAPLDDNKPSQTGKNGACGAPLWRTAPSDTHLVGCSSFLLMQMACPLQYHWLS